MIEISTEDIRKQHVLGLNATRVHVPIRASGDEPPHIYPKGSSIARGIAMVRGKSRFFVNVEEDFKVTIPDHRAIPRTRDMTDDEKMEFVASIKRDEVLLKQINANERLKRLIAL